MWSKMKHPNPSQFPMSPVQVRRPHHNQIQPNRSGQFNPKFSKPSQPIYRPPSARTNQLEHSFFQVTECYNESSQPPEAIYLHQSAEFCSKPNSGGQLKSALKRSKSFGANTNFHPESLNMLMALDGIPWENVSQVRRALESSESMTMNQLMQVVRIVCNKALEKSSNAYAMANICLDILDKQKNQRSHLFGESLLNCLREWFNEKDSLRSLPGGTRRWTAYIAFVNEMYLNLRSKFKNDFRIDTEDNDDEDDEWITSFPVIIESQRKHFSSLLLDSCQATLSSENLSPSEIECLHSVFQTSGRQLKEDHPSRMVLLVNMLREVFLAPNQTLAHQVMMCHKTLLEMIELAASNWQFNQAQLIYYFPYTKPNE